MGCSNSRWMIGLIGAVLLLSVFCSSIVQSSDRTTNNNNDRESNTERDGNGNRLSLPDHCSVKARIVKFQQVLKRSGAFEVVVEVTNQTKHKVVIRRSLSAPQSINMLICDRFGKRATVQNQLTINIGRDRRVWPADIPYPKRHRRPTSSV